MSYIQYDKMVEKMKVSFDYDGTLDIYEVQVYAAELMRRGYEVWMLQSRPDIYTGEEVGKGFVGKPDNSDLYMISEMLGIRPEHIFFTCYEHKSVFFKNKDFLIHFDDKDFEVNSINNNTNTVGMLVMGEDWKNEANMVIEKLSKEYENTKK